VNAVISGIASINNFSEYLVLAFSFITGMFFSLSGAVTGLYLRIMRYVVAILIILPGIMPVRKITLFSGFFRKLRLKIHPKILSSSGFPVLIFSDLVTG